MLRKNTVKQEKLHTIKLELQEKLETKADANAENLKRQLTEEKNTGSPVKLSEVYERTLFAPRW